MAKSRRNSKSTDPTEKQTTEFLQHIFSQHPDFSRGECRITFELGKGLLIEGVRSVCEYTDDRLIIATPSHNIVIEGCCLCICSLMEDSIVICGQIACLRFM